MSYAAMTIHALYVMIRNAGCSHILLERKVDPTKQPPCHNRHNPLERPKFIPLIVIVRSLEVWLEAISAVLIQDGTLTRVEEHVVAWHLFHRDSW
jgi:hypothetical protein